MGIVFLILMIPLMFLLAAFWSIVESFWEIYLWKKASEKSSRE